MKQLTFMTSIITGLLLILPAPFIEKAHAGEAVNAKVLATSLNVRSEPSNAASVIGSLPYGTAVTVSEESFGWALITSGKRTGWVAGYYLQKLNATTAPVTRQPAQPKPQTSPPPANVYSNGTVSADALRMREGPGVDTKIIRVLSAGTRLDIIGRNADWLKARTSDGQIGWVMGTYVDTGTKGSMPKSNRTPGLKGKVIVVDPGHGGNDVGAISTKLGLHEKMLTLQTAQYLGERLRRAGATVIMTRNADNQRPTLETRVEVSETKAADAFISLHYNSSPKPASGTLTFYYSAEKDKPLAGAIESRLAQGTGLKSNGISFGDYHVLRENERPSVLVELGFLTNPRDESVVSTAAYQQKAAAAIVDGLRDYFNK